MRKLLWASLILLLLAGVAAVIVVVGFFAYRYYHASPPEPPRQAESVAEIEQEDAPPLPDVSLSINRQKELQVFQGTPLIVTLRAGNPRAANTLATNQAHARSLALIQQKLSKGELSAQEAEPMLELARVTREVKTVRLGTSDRGWEKSLRLEAQTAGSPFAPVNWPLALVQPPEAKSVLLDGNTNAQVDYALDAQAAAQVPAGDYVVRAVLEVAADPALPQGLWRGRVTSDPVSLKIVPLPAQPSAADRASMNLQRAEFSSTTKDWANALRGAQAALQEDPKLIRAQIITGQAKEAQGDLAGARAAFSEALRLFDEQHPDSYERPQYLIHRLAALDARLGRPRP